MDRGRTTKLAVTGLFVFISLATLIAHRSPATGYEITIYRGTPTAYWVLLGIVLIGGSAMAIWDHHRSLSVLAVGMAMLTFLLLPLIRGYFYIGQQDPLSHLGSLSSVLAGRGTQGTDLYPAFYHLPETLAHITGLPARRVLMLLTAILTATFFAFLPLLVREIDPSPDTVTVGALIAVGLLPLNPFNVHLWPQPASQILFFTIVPLYLFFRSLRNGQRRAFVISFLVVSTAVLLFNPQQALNILVITTTAALTVSILNTRSISIYRRTPLSAVLGLAAVIITHLINTNRFADVFSASILSIFISDSTGQREATSILGSLDVLGVSLEGFTLAIVGKYLPLIVPVGIAVYVGFTRRDRVELPLLAFGGMFILPFFGYFLLAGNTNQWGRYIGFLAVLFCVFAAVGLGTIRRQLASTRGRTVARVVIAVLICTSLLASVPVMHPSERTLKSNEQVTEGMYSGMTTALNHTDPQDPVMNIRASPGRYATAERMEEPETQYPAPDHFNGHQLSAVVDQRTYLITTDLDYQTDAVLYNGFRFSRTDFDYLSQDPHINKVQSGNVSLHVVDEE